MDVCSVFGFTQSWEINLFSHVILILSATNDCTCICLDPSSPSSVFVKKWKSGREARGITGFLHKENVWLAYCTINIFMLDFYTFCARRSCRVSPGHWKSAVLLFCGATGQLLHSSLWLPLFSADKWLSQPPLIRAFLPIHQLSIPGFTLAAQKGRQKQRRWLTGQIYQHNLLTQINKNSPTSKAVLSHFSHHFIGGE